MSDELWLLFFAIIGPANLYWALQDNPLWTRTLNWIGLGISLFSAFLILLTYKG